MTGATLLHPGSPVRQLADSQHLGCCVLAACWSLAMAGRVPIAVHRLDSWAILAGPQLWRQLNRWAGTGVWTVMQAHQQLVGGEVVIGSGLGDYPSLTPGRWHVIQELADDLVVGHTYLVQAVSRSWMYDSTTARGYLARELPGWPRRPDRRAGVLTLPHTL